MNNYDHVVFEKLQIQNMLKNHCLAKSIVDASWSQLINLTIYKAEYAGKIVELVNPNGTSQTCICGYHVPKTLAVRVHSCPSCGLVLNRDHVSDRLLALTKDPDSDVRWGTAVALGSAFFLSPSQGTR